MNTNTIGKNIKKIRMEKNYTQEYLAEKLGVSATAYRKMEQGETQITISKLEQIATILEKEITHFLNNDQHNYNLNNNKLEHSIVIQHNYTPQEHFEKILSIKDELLAAKDKEIELLRKMLESKG